MQSVFLFYQSVFFVLFFQHIDAVLMASALKLRSDEYFCYFLCCGDADDSCAHAEHICIIVQAGELGGNGIAAECRADTAMLICRDAHADARAAYEYAEIGTRIYGFANLARIFGIVYGGIGICAHINAFISHLREHFYQLVFVEIAGMVCTKNNFFHNVFLFLIILSFCRLLFFRKLAFCLRSAKIDGQERTVAENALVGGIFICI